jgi:SAM-dependent methyltransferase
MEELENVESLIEYGWRPVAVDAGFGCAWTRITLSRIVSAIVEAVSNSRTGIPAAEETSAPASHDDRSKAGTTTDRCRICSSACDGPFTARELMFGFRDSFDYYQCRDCGMLQISQYPPDLTPYYPKEYYSLNKSKVAGTKAIVQALGPARPLAERAIRWIRRHRTRHELGAFDPSGALLVRLRGERPTIARLRPARVTLDSAILEVGCGDGFLLRQLFDAGFRNLEGVDPFTLEADRSQKGFVIRRALAEVDRRFDVVLLADSLEHMPDQRSVFQGLKLVCASTGYVCIAVPVVGRAWSIYRTNWVQLDAPRHLYLHTEKSISRLAEEAGFTVSSVIYDSTAFQFWGSEQYQRDIPLAKTMDAYRTHFSTEQLRTWNEEAGRLNAARLGDHAVFYLRPSG